jgi:hypothetical protein
MMLLREAHAEANPANGLDPPGIAQLLPDGGHMCINCLRRAVPVTLPDMLEDLCAPPHGTGVLRKIGEDIELLGSQGDLLPIDVDPLGTSIDG